jgi:hypothetical protein
VGYPIEDNGYEVGTQEWHEAVKRQKIKQFLTDAYLLISAVATIILIIEIINIFIPLYSGKLSDCYQIKTTVGTQSCIREYFKAHPEESDN